MPKNELIASKGKELREPRENLLQLPLEKALEDEDFAIRAIACSNGDMAFVRVFNLNAMIDGFNQHRKETGCQGKPIAFGEKSQKRKIQRLSDSNILRFD